LNYRRHGDGAEMKLQVLARLHPSDGSISFSHACFFWTGLRGRRAELSSSLLQPPYMYEPLVRSHYLSWLCCVLVVTFWCTLKPGIEDMLGGFALM
jgi:hypothetical protein